MYRKERKIPTILGILILIFGIGISVYLDKTVHLVTSQAATHPVPVEVHFTNLTDSSFAVSWLTPEPATGSIALSDSQQTLIFFDDLDSDNIQRARITHYVTIKNLKEDYIYSVKVISGDKKCANPAACPTFIQKTVKKLPPSTFLPPLQSKAITSTNQPVNGAIVYVLVEKCLLLSGRVDSAGLWVVPFTNLRSVVTSTPPQFADTDLVQVIIKLSPNQETSAVIDIKSMRENSALPTMTIGTSYNFIDLVSKKDILAKLNNQNQKTLGLQIQAQATKKPEAPTQAQQTIDILFPAFDNDTAVDNRPSFRGVGIKGKELLITVNSSSQVGKVRIGPAGTWVWRPSKALSPGIHNISIQGYDEGGNSITINRKFIVLKSGEQVLGEATPSASLTPTATPTTTITPTPSPVLSPTPSPTSLPPPTATSIPTSPPSPPPRSGNLQPTFILLGGAVSLLLLGTKFLLFP